MMLACACSNDPPGSSCGVTGRERSCPCSGSAVGIQACQFDGQWEPCTCYPRSGSATAGSSGIAANGGSGGMSAAAGSSNGGSTGQRASGDRAAGGGGTPAPWNPWDGFPGFAGFPWSR
jgi:hypothetical protein